MQTIPTAPPTRREPVIDDFHGQAIADPYRWLEDAESGETRRWVEEQNAHTRSLLDAVPGREALHARLADLNSIGIVTAPAVRRGRYFYQRREGHQNQPVLYMREGRDGAERLLLDPNEASAEGTVALDWWYPSHDGSSLAYGYSSEGNEWSTLFVLDVESGTLLPDRIERTKYASVAWLPDNSGLYYTRYPRVGDVAEGEENYWNRFYFHRLGTEPVSDPEVHVTELAREDMLSISISRDGRFLVAQIMKGWERANLYLRDLTSPDSPFRPVAEGYDALFNGVVDGETLYIHTNHDAPRYRLYRVSASDPARENWEEVIPERDDAVLDSFALTPGRIVAGYLRNATSAVSVFDRAGSRLFDVDLPALGTVTAITGNRDEPEAFYSFESFTIPSTVYRIDLEAGESRIWADVGAHLRSEDFTVRQQWYTSRDGTRVSMFLVHRADLDRGMTHPTVLTGYGGFNLSRTPLFFRNVIPWLEKGGVYALPNLRGGGEYGEEWHRAGMLEHKQNVFDDFIAAAEYLIAQGYAEPSKLAILGGSNGGLLVGAAMTQRPDLFRAVVCQVPLLDMLRYHRFLIARLWIAEYGSADNPEQFPYIYAYSPYHHVREGERYPAVLFTTAESDSRVEPLHARKMAALLQAANASEHPILLRVETRAGHGVGKPLTKIIEE
ncbi:MAG TPA: prolyl oligopeptidase family serine peptidase, partial [Chloroflexota bacterium]